MKAWKVYDLHGYSEGMTVVFAPTRGKAKVVALSTDTLDDADFTCVGVSRFPEMDSHYRGYAEMDWDNMEDRETLVQQGWKCYEPEFEDCLNCPCKDDCSGWEDWQERIEEDRAWAEIKEGNDED